MGAFDTSLGALLIGAFHEASVNTYLYGLSTFQYGSYWNTEFNDPLWMKLSVVLLFCIDTAHSAAVCYLAWAHMVANYANPSYLNKLLWPLPASMIVISILAFGVQNFLAMRIYRLVGYKWLLYIFAVWSTATMVFGFIYGAKIALLEKLSDILTLRKPLTIWLSLEVALDSTISAVLFTALQRSRTGFRRSDAVLNRLTRSAIQSGVFTSVLAILALVCFSALSDTLFYVTFGIPCARAYTISLMDTLLCRKELRVIMNSDHTKDGFGVTTIPDIFARQVPSPSGTWQMHIRKEVQTEVRYETQGSRTRTSESLPEDLIAKPPPLVVEGMYNSHSGISRG
ncbi:hypothetical protein FA13DRAFT_63197 [Coprinellus micaceus]|uniref:DUF6534 domain-containing protein n=1 Tax=Coprinellus micaceus TaxID=71717 RepID=A0A4Y7TJA2_COPMI|nr:hypothetical protein FA13DRAFT_63197 [Coprinellus micaceus]